MSRPFLQNGPPRFLHILVTVLVGPPIGALALLATYLHHFKPPASASSLAEIAFAMAYFTYSIGIIPAIISASLSNAASHRTQSAVHHLMLSPIFGAVAAGMLAIFPLLSGRWNPGGIALFTLIGALAAFGTTLLTYLISRLELRIME